MQATKLMHMAKEKKVVLATFCFKDVDEIVSLIHVVSVFVRLFPKNFTKFLSLTLVYSNYFLYFSFRGLPKHESY